MPCIDYMIKPEAEKELQPVIAQLFNNFSFICCFRVVRLCLNIQWFWSMINVLIMTAKFWRWYFWHISVFHAVVRWYIWHFSVLHAVVRWYIWHFSVFHAVVRWYIWHCSVLHAVVRWYIWHFSVFHAVVRLYVWHISVFHAVVRLYIWHISVFHAVVILGSKDIRTFYWSTMWFPMGRLKCEANLLTDRRTDERLTMDAM